MLTIAAHQRVVDVNYGGLGISPEPGGDPG